MTRHLPAHTNGVQPESPEQNGCWDQLPRVPGAPGHAAAPSRPPAARIYAALRRTRGYSHEEATRHLRHTLKRYFRAA